MKTHTRRQIGCCSWRSFEYCQSISDAEISNRTREFLNLDMTWACGWMVHFRCVPGDPRKGSFCSQGVGRTADCLNAGVLAVADSIRPGGIHSKPGHPIFRVSKEEAHAHFLPGSNPKISSKPSFLTFCCCSLLCLRPFAPLFLFQSQRCGTQFQFG